MIVDRHGRRISGTGKRSPTGRLRVNRDNPMTHDLRCCFCPTPFSIYEAVSKKHLFPPNAIYGHSPEGNLSAEWDAGGAGGDTIALPVFIEMKHDRIASMGVIGYRPPAAEWDSNRGNLILMGSTVATIGLGVGFSYAGEKLSFAFRTTNGTVVTGLTDAGKNVETVGSASADIGANFAEMYQDAQYNSKTDASGNPWPLIDRVHFGQNQSGGDDSDLGFSLFCLWDTYLSLKDHISFNNNPWQVVEPEYGRSRVFLYAVDPVFDGSLLLQTGDLLLLQAGDELLAQSSSQAVTLSGTLSSQSAAITGAVERVIPLSGTVSAQSAGISGNVNRLIEMSGTLVASQSQISGAIERIITASGTVSAENALISGVVERAVTLSGTAASQQSGITGAVERAITLNGTVQAANAGISGNVTTDGAVVLSGVLPSQPATVSGVVERTITASGTLASEAAQVTGNVDSFSVITIDGVLASSDANVSGNVLNLKTLSGTVTSQSANITGQVEKTVNLSGSLQSGLSGISGTIKRILDYQGTVASQNATAQGSVTTQSASFQHPASRTLTSPETRPSPIVTHSVDGDIVPIESRSDTFTPKES